jgi:hypothetical protein
MRGRLYESPGGREYRLRQSIVCRDTQKLLDQVQQLEFGLDGPYSFDVS